MNCSIVVPIGPSHQSLAKRAVVSVQQAIAHGKGAFTSIGCIELRDTDGSLGRSRARNLGVKQAREQGADWVFFLDADDLMAEDAFEAVAELLPHHDAIWGAIYVADSNGGEEVNRRPGQISPLSTLADLLVNDPYLTLQMGHFVRCEIATRYPFDTSMDTGEDFDYYLRVWKENRCIKIDRALFYNVRGQHSSGPRSATGSDWRIAVNKVFCNFCRDNEVVATVPFNERFVKFRLSNTLDHIQNYLAHDQFFESRELFETLLCLPATSRVLDIGSNIGNHALFLTVIGGAKEIHCFEPAPQTADFLERNFHLNDIAADRYRIHRIGIGSGLAKARIQNVDQSNLGATSLMTNANGDIVVDSIDHLYPNGHFDLLKVDVEGMELEVLRGAQELITRSRPLILIEVANANKAHFLVWVARNGYRLHRSFELVNASNYLLLPWNPRGEFYKNGMAATREWTSKVPLAIGQPPCGWSINDFVRCYFGDDRIIEVHKGSTGLYVAHDLSNEKRGPFTGSAESVAQMVAGNTVLLGDILNAVEDREFETLLDVLAACVQEIVLFDIMDARWQRAFRERPRCRDAEHYICCANKRNFLLKGYYKIPHKAATGAHEQLENRITLLHFIRQCV